MDRTLNAIPEVISLRDFSELHINLPLRIGSNGDWSNGFFDKDRVIQNVWMTDTQKELVKELLDGLCHVTMIAPYAEHITIRFVDDENAIHNITACCKIMARVLSVPERSWRIRRDERFQRALKSYYDLVGAGPLDPLAELNMSNELGR